MKKAIVLGTVAALSFAAQAEMKAPTVYGRLHKEFRYSQQDDSVGARTSNGVREGKNAPSLLGAKGTIPVNEMFNIGYKIELGTQSNLAKGTDAHVRVAAMDLNSKFGTLTFGQTYVAGFAVKSFDPLISTAAGQFGLSQKEDLSQFDKATGDTYRAAVEGVGLRERHRQDLIGYKSPKMMGFQFHITHDNNEGSSADEKVTTNDIVQYTDSVLSYDNKFGMFGVKAHLGYQLASGSAANEETQMTGALKVSYMGAELSGIYTATNWEVSAKDVDKTQMFVALAYNFNEKCKVAATYATSETDNKSAATKDEATQMSLGYIHTFNKNVMVDVTASQYEFKGDNVNSGASLDKPMLASAGLTLMF